MYPPTISFIIILCTLSSSTTADPDPAQQNSPKDFVDAHNKARAAVGVGPLKWDDRVAGYAIQYAKKRYSDCKLEHSEGPYGENLASGWGRLSAVDAVGMWVSERSNYDHASNQCVGGACLHYTQVVWRNSVRLGCARLQCRNGGLFVICSYDPPGNYIGESPY